MELHRKQWFILLGRDHTTGVLSRCRPVLPLCMIRGEIFSESFVDTSVWPTLSDNVRAVQIQS